MEQEKQEKALSKINHAIEGGGQTTAHINELKKNPNDECYTSMEDILEEMKQWALLGKFKDKNIICPCDWDIVDGESIYSITINYTDRGVDVFGNTVKKAEIKYDLWSDDDSIETIQVEEKDIDDFLRNKLTCNFLRTFTQNARRWGIKSITASGYNPATGKGVSFEDVDYSEYDICCTNPPFSIYKEFMSAILGKIDFIVLSPFLKRTTYCVGLPLMLKQCFLGFGSDITNMKFINPTSANGYTTKSVDCGWITTYPEAQEERNARFKNKKTGIDYNLYKEDYLEMPNMTMKDGTHPIKVPTTQIPDNYDGWMLGSIQFLDLYDLSQFEWYGTDFGKYYNETNPKANPFNHKVSGAMLKVGLKNDFGGIVFRRIKK